jgi:hypothetical protein
MFRPFLLSLLDPVIYKENADAVQMDMHADV